VYKKFINDICLLHWGAIKTLVKLGGNGMGIELKAVARVMMDWEAHNIPKPKKA